MNVSNIGAQYLKYSDSSAKTLEMQDGIYIIYPACYL